MKISYKYFLHFDQQQEIKKSFLLWKFKDFEISRIFVFVLICQSCPNQQLTFTKTRLVLKTKPYNFSHF